MTAHIVPFRAAALSRGDEPGAAAGFTPRTMALYTVLGIDPRDPLTVADAVFSPGTMALYTRLGLDPRDPLPAAGAPAVSRAAG